jgi:hypothetical protein
MLVSEVSKRRSKVSAATEAEFNAKHGVEVVANAGKGGLENLEMRAMIAKLKRKSEGMGGGAALAEEVGKKSGKQRKF